MRVKLDVAITTADALIKEPSMQILSKIAIFYKKIDRFSHLLVGMPSYDKYVEYMQKFHPNETPQTQREFFKEALEKKYGAGSSKCC